MPRLGIVIPTVGRLDALRLALARLEGQCGELSQFEVVVVHSADTDADAVQRALAHRPYTVRRLLSPRGDASSQRNAGWRQLSTPLVLFVGEDILASPRLVAAHLQAHARWPQRNVG